LISTIVWQTVGVFYEMVKGKFSFFFVRVRANRLCSRPQTIYETIPYQRVC